MAATGKLQADKKTAARFIQITMPELEQPHYQPDPEALKRAETEAQEFLKVGQKQIAEAKQTEQARWEDKEVSRLRMSELNRLDQNGQQYLEGIIKAQVNVPGKGYISQDQIRSVFKAVVELLRQGRVNGVQDATVSEVLSLGEVKLKSIISEVIPETIPQNPEDIKITESVKKDVTEAASLLRLNIERYAMSQGNLLGKEGAIESALRSLRKNTVGLSPNSQQREQLRGQLLEQIDFLNALQANPELIKDSLDREVLSLESDRNNPNRPLARMLKLSYAIEYSAGYFSSLRDYIKQIRNPDTIVGRQLQDRVYHALEMIAGGYQEKEFTYEDSLAQLNSGTAGSPGGINYGFMTPGVVDKVRILKAIGEEDAGANSAERLRG